MSQKSATISDPDAAIATLYEVKLQMKGLGYLLENQAPDAAPPIDFDERMAGVGSILNMLGDKILRSTAELDNFLVEKSNSRQSARRNIND